MKYVVKNGKIYGISMENYDNLVSHPSINNTLIDQAKDYTTDDLNIIKGPMSLEEYNAIDPKNPNTIYVVSTDTSVPLDQVNYLDLQNKPLINGVVLTGDKSLASLGIYSISQVDNLLASLRSIKVVSTKPSSSEVIPNTMYYVGTQTPYQVYLYDSNKTEISLGSSEVQQVQAGSGLSLSNGVMDHSNSVTPKTNTKIVGVSYDGQGHITGKSSEYDISTALNLSSTDLQIPTNKTIFDKTPQASLTHLQAGDLTTMDDFFSLLLEAEDTTHVTSTKVRTGFGYVTLPQFIINDLTAIGLENTGYGNAFFKAQKVKSTADVLYGYIELQYLYGYSSAVNVRNSTGWVGWKLKQCDSFAPISSVYNFLPTNTAPQVNDCLFNMPNLTHCQQVKVGIFTNAQLTEPISSADTWGYVNVTENVARNLSTGECTYSIEQEFTATYITGIGNLTNRQYKFRRTGYATAQLNTNVYDNRGNITWQPWYPLEYRKTDVPDSWKASTTNYWYGELTFHVGNGLFYFSGYLTYNGSATGWITPIYIPNTIHFKFDTGSSNANWVLGTGVSEDGETRVFRLQRNNSDDYNRMYLKGLTSGKRYYFTLRAPLGY